VYSRQVRFTKKFDKNDVKILKHTKCSSILEKQVASTGQRRQTGKVGQLGQVGQRVDVLVQILALDREFLQLFATLAQQLLVLVQQALLGATVALQVLEDRRARLHLLGESDAKFNDCLRYINLICISKCNFAKEPKREDM